MQTSVTSWTVAALGAFLVATTGDALAPGEPARACDPVAELAAQAKTVSVHALDPASPALVRHLARRFTVAHEAIEGVVEAAHRAAREVGLDPLLVLAVIAVESRFNPIAESVRGAKGLMQIIPRYHLAKLEEHGGEAAALDPESNILVGARILQEYVYRFGSLEAGLQFYNGAYWDPTAQYAKKVLAERERLELVLRAPGRS
jgi:soluble lytic murein transglycosylase-like protein